MIVSMNRNEIETAIFEYLENRGVAVARGSIMIEVFGESMKASADTIERQPKETMSKFLTELTGVKISPESF